MNKDIHAPYIYLISIRLKPSYKGCVQSVLIYVEQALVRFAGKPQGLAWEIILRSWEGPARTGRLYRIAGY